MIRAQKEGRLHREQQFMVGIPAKDMEIAQSEELVLVQGMIDAWIEEEDGLVLIDYKSDRTGRNGEQQLIRRYRIQLEYYKRSLEQITGRQVKEAVISRSILEKKSGYKRNLKTDMRTRLHSKTAFDTMTWGGICCPHDE